MHLLDNLFETIVNLWEVDEIDVTTWESIENCIHFSEMGRRVKFTWERI